MGHWRFPQQVCPPHPWCLFKSQTSPHLMWFGEVVWVLDKMGSSNFLLLVPLFCNSDELFSEAGWTFSVLATLNCLFRILSFLIWSLVVWFPSSSVWLLFWSGLALFPWHHSKALFCQVLGDGLQWMHLPFCGFCLNQALCSDLHQVWATPSHHSSWTTWFFYLLAVVCFLGWHWRFVELWCACHLEFSCISPDFISVWCTCIPPWTCSDVSWALLHVADLSKMTFHFTCSWFSQPLVVYDTILLLAWQSSQHRIGRGVKSFLTVIELDFLDWPGPGTWSYTPLPSQPLPIFDLVWSFLDAGLLIVCVCLSKAIQLH